MYNLYEIAFMIIYFGGLAVVSTIGLIFLQGLIYRLTGISPYRIIMRTADKLIKEEF